MVKYTKIKKYRKFCKSPRKYRNIFLYKNPKIPLHINKVFQYTLQRCLPKEIVIPNICPKKKLRITLDESKEVKWCISNNKIPSNIDFTYTKQKTRYLPKGLNKVLFSTQRNLCNICAKPLKLELKKMYHDDHIIPFSYCHSNQISNHQILCLDCHRWKTDDFDNHCRDLYNDLIEYGVNEVNRIYIFRHQIYFYTLHLLDEKISLSLDKELLKNEIHWFDKYLIRLEKIFLKNNICKQKNICCDNLNKELLDKISDRMKIIKNFF
jgi:hypothetical protein